MLRQLALARAVALALSSPAFAQQAAPGWTPKQLQQLYAKCHIFSIEHEGVRGGRGSLVCSWRRARLTSRSRNSLTHVSRVAALLANRRSTNA
jgi:hypothetical protein